MNGTAINENRPNVENRCIHVDPLPVVIIKDRHPEDGPRRDATVIGPKGNLHCAICAAGGATGPKGIGVETLRALAQDARARCSAVIISTQGEHAYGI